MKKIVNYLREELNMIFQKNAQNENDKNNVVILELKDVLTLKDVKIHIEGKIENIAASMSRVNVMDIDQKMIHEIENMNQRKLLVAQLDTYINNLWNTQNEPNRFDKFLEITEQMFSNQDMWRLITSSLLEMVSEQLSSNITLAQSDVDTKTFRARQKEISRYYSLYNRILKGGK